MLMKSEIYEVFFRDGSYALDFGFTARHVEIVGAAMERAGFPYVEIGHGYGLGAARAGYPAAAQTDEEYLAAASAVFRKTAFGAFYIPGIGAIDDIRMALGYGIRFISIGQNITAIKEAETAVRFAGRQGLHTTVCMMKAHLPDDAAFGEIVKRIQAWEPDCICIMDSAGCLTPDMVRRKVEQIRAAGGAAGFHGHNNLQLATANALAASDAGAVRLDASLGGLGRSAGNAHTEILSALFERLGRPLSPALAQAEMALGAVAGAGIALPLAVPLTDILLGLHGLHSSIAPALDEEAARHGVAKAKLYEAVARKNPVNPTRAEIASAAAALRHR